MAPRPAAGSLLYATRVIWCHVTWRSVGVAARREGGVNGRPRLGPGADSVPVGWPGCTCVFTWRAGRRCARRDLPPIAAAARAAGLAENGVLFLALGADYFGGQ